MALQTLAVRQDFVLKSMHSVALAVSWLGIASQLWQKPGLLMNMFPTLVLAPTTRLSALLLHISTPRYVFHRL